MYGGVLYDVFLSLCLVCLVWVLFSERGNIISVPKVALGCGWTRYFVVDVLEHFDLKIWAELPIVL